MRVAGMSNIFGRLWAQSGRRFLAFPGRQVTSALRVVDRAIARAEHYRARAARSSSRWTTVGAARNQRPSIYRIIYFFFSGRRIVLLHGFQKKTERTPSKELQIAAQRYNAFVRRKED